MGKLATLDFDGGAPGSPRELAATAIVVATSDDWARAVHVRSQGGGHLLPVLDLVGYLGEDADCGDYSRQGEIVHLFLERRRRLAQWVAASERAPIRLLAHLYVRGKPLLARYMPDTRAAIGYGTLCPVERPRQVAELLAASGYLTRRHFDRAHICDQCGSSRFNVREECSACRSSDLHGVTLLHHFRCAYQGPDSDFRTESGRLVCPKCARELRHYGSDYEHSGTVQRCGACSHAGTDPAVGLVCLDCWAHYDGDRVRTVDYYHYDLTDAALALLQQGVDHRGLIEAPGMSSLPLQLIRRLAQTERQDLPRTLLFQIEYAGARRVIHEHGPAAFDQARRLFLADLGARLGDGFHVSEGAVYDFVLATADVTGSAEQMVAVTLPAVARTLAMELSPGVTVLSADELVPCST